MTKISILMTSKLDSVKAKRNCIENSHCQYCAPEISPPDRRIHLYTRGFNVFTNNVNSYRVGVTVSKYSRPCGIQLCPKGRCNCSYHCRNKCNSELWNPISDRCIFYFAPFQASESSDCSVWTNLITVIE